MGIGVSQVEVEVAEKLVHHVPSLEKVLLTSTGSEATFHALRVSRAATGRRHVIKFQGCYHGWHDSVAMNVISPAERVGQKDPLSQGILPEVLDATIVCRFNDADQVERALEEYDVAAIILELIPHNIGAVLPQPGFLERLRELATKHGTVLVFDEVITGFRHGLGGYQAIAGVTPDLTTLGKAMANGWPVSALGGKAELMDLFSTTPGRPAFFAGTFNGHPATTAAALATIEKLEREPVHEHVFRLGERARTELQALYDRMGVPAVVSGFGSVFVSYFLEGPVVSYDDLLRNDVDLFIGYRRELMKDGIFELPLNLKRSHFSYAHTDDDVDRLLEATEGAVKRHLESRVDRCCWQPAVSCSIDLSAPGKQIGHLAFPRITNTAGWASTVRPHRLDRERRRPDGARPRRQPRRRVRGPGRGDAAAAGAAARAGARPRHRRPRPLPRRLEGEHAQLALRRELQPLLPRPARRAAERAARRLPHARPLPAGRRRHRHALGRAQRLVHPLLAHARRRRPGAAEGDARGDGGVDVRLALPLHRRQRHRASCRSRRRTRGSS